MNHHRARSILSIFQTNVCERCHVRGFYLSTPFGTKAQNVTQMEKRKS